MYQIAVFIHVLGAIVWAGGIVFLTLVAVPAARRFDSATRARVIGALGRQFRLVGWTALGLMALTGVYALSVRGATIENTLVDGSFWATPFGQVLGIKLILVLLMVAVSFVHDFVVGPATIRSAEAGVEEPNLRRQAAWLARITGLLALGVVFAAVMMLRPGLFS